MSSSREFLLAASVSRWRARFGSLDPTLRAILWTCAAGLLFAHLNTVLRLLAMHLDPFQVQFLRYLFGCIVMAPLILRGGLAAYWPKRLTGQFARGFLHCVGLWLWFAALPHVPMADMTALSFTSPIFIMVGAYLFFRETMHRDRWLAVAAGFAGVLIVLAPRLSGSGGLHHLIMLASSPVFAASFLLTKSLTRDETTGVIVVWQAISITVFSLVPALMHWQPVAPLQWLGFALCGVLGSLGHYCLTRSFGAADISSTQSVKFLDLVWSSALGWLVFADVPSASALAGGVVIAAATLWITRREARRRARETARF
jgi:drug/metabolite transporter (DMT)-like permease